MYHKWLANTFGASELAIPNKVYPFPYLTPKTHKFSLGNLWSASSGVRTQDQQSGTKAAKTSRSKNPSNRWPLMEFFIFRHVSSNDNNISDTHPKFNIAPENGWLEAHFPFGKVTFERLSYTSGVYINCFYSNFLVGGFVFAIHEWKRCVFLSTLNWMFFFKLQGTNYKKISEKAASRFKCVHTLAILCDSFGMVKKWPFQRRIVTSKWDGVSQNRSISNENIQCVYTAIPVIDWTSK